MRLVYFYKDDCEPCAARKPLAVEIAGEVELPLILVDATIDREWAERHRVRTVPTLVLENCGGHRLVGLTGPLINQATISKVVEKNPCTCT